MLGPAELSTAWLGVTATHGYLRLPEDLFARAAPASEDRTYSIGIQGLWIESHETDGVGECLNPPASRRCPP